MINLWQVKNTKNDKCCTEKKEKKEKSASITSQLLGRTKELVYFLHEIKVTHLAKLKGSR